MRTTAINIAGQLVPVETITPPSERCPECRWFLDESICRNRMCPAFGSVQHDNDEDGGRT
jgi:hypothetical protein